jgi:hypothetical protein
MRTMFESQQQLYKHFKRQHAATVRRHSLALFPEMNKSEKSKCGILFFRYSERFIRLEVYIL